MPCPDEDFHVTPKDIHGLIGGRLILHKISLILQRSSRLLQTARAAEIFCQQKVPERIYNSHYGNGVPVLLVLSS